MFQYHCHDEANCILVFVLKQSDYFQRLPIMVLTHTHTHTKHNDKSTHDKIGLVCHCIRYSLRALNRIKHINFFHFIVSVNDKTKFQ